MLKTIRPSTQSALGNVLLRSLKSLKFYDRDWPPPGRPRPSWPRSGPYHAPGFPSRARDTYPRKSCGEALGRARRGSRQELRPPGGGAPPHAAQRSAHFQAAAPGPPGQGFQGARVEHDATVHPRSPTYFSMSASSTGPCSASSWSRSSMSSLWRRRRSSSALTAALICAERPCSSRSSSATRSSSNDTDTLRFGEVIPEAYQGRKRAGNRLPGQGQGARAGASGPPRRSIEQPPAPQEIRLGDQHLVACISMRQRDRRASPSTAVDGAQAEGAAALVVDDPAVLEPETPPPLEVVLRGVEGDLHGALGIAAHEELHLLIGGIQETVEADLPPVEVRDVEPHHAIR